MPTITFYRQARRDGGIRTGIEVDGDAVLTRFDHGRARREPDPAIVWYVDVKCRGSTLPTHSDAARLWLLRQEKPISRLLSALADEIPAGIDPTDWPLRREWRLPSKVQVVVTCSAVRRLEASRLSKILREVAAHWRQTLEHLAPVEA